MPRVIVHTGVTTTVVQTLTYYPYGALRTSNATGTDGKRKFLGLFTDDSNLVYANARYLDPSRGQFLSQDRKFIAASFGLEDPQRSNGYSYAKGNPIAFFDVNGLDSAYFAARSAVGPYNHIYEAYSFDSQQTANQLNLGIPVPNNVSPSNPFNFTIGFGPSKSGWTRTGTGNPLVMQIEHSGGSGRQADYDDAQENGFNSSVANLTVGSYGNYASLANASVRVGEAISNAGNTYFGLGSYTIWDAITRRNNYNSNGSMGTLAYSTGQGGTFSQFASTAKAPGSGNYVPTSPSSGFSGGGTVNGSTPMLIGNSIGAFVGTYNFGPGAGTYNFGTKSWQ